MPKYEILESIAKKLSVLDNEVKLKILALLVDQGAKSITDISKDLGINFSTAHKYLEQLEAANLVTSKEVSENRLKRMFVINDFNIELSPKSISEILSAKKTKETKKTFNVINEKGEVVDFDEKLFSQKYLKRGLPHGTISSALNSVLDQAYNNMTLLELRKLFRQALEKKVENIASTLKQIDELENHKRTYAHLLQMTHPEALDMHANGDIFIKNLREPKLLNFMHDLRGITIHGVNGKIPKTLQELFNQTLFAISFVSDFVSGTQAFDSFNYLIAPLTKDLKEAALRKAIKEFFDDLDTLNKEIFISLEIGTPNFIKTLATGYITEKDTTSYVTYRNVADNITKIVLNLFQNGYKNLHFTAKIWNKKELGSFDWPSGTHIANMTASWQHPNASFAGCNVRLNPEWRKWIGTNRCGEAQEIIINLPRLAITSSSLQDFLVAFEKTISKCCDFIENMAELSLGEFLRKHNIQLKSVQTRRWSYLIIENSSYAISVLGLKNACDILIAKTGEKNLFEKILKKCNDVIDQKVKVPLRVLLKESLDENIAKRFSYLDTKLKTNLPEYSISGLDIKDLQLQSFLWGGGCTQINKNQIKNLKNIEFGFVKINY